MQCVKPTWCASSMHHIINVHNSIGGKVDYQIINHHKFITQYSFLFSQVGAPAGSYQCVKTYKTKGGLRRHKHLKHSLSFEQSDTVKAGQINNVKLNLLIEKAAKTLSEDKCFLSDHQQLFSTFKITTDE